jgi:ABC-type glycerol-3-phosphate transport system substrate-binding protein
MQPALVKVANSPAFLNAPPPGRKFLLDMPNHAHYMPFMAGWDELLKTQINPATDRVWYGQKTPEQVFPELIANLNGKFFKETAK